MVLGVPGVGGPGAVVDLLEFEIAGGGAILLQKVSDGNNHAHASRLNLARVYHIQREWIIPDPRLLLNQKQKGSRKGGKTQRKAKKEAPGNRVDAECLGVGLGC